MATVGDFLIERLHAQRFVTALIVPRDVQEKSERER